MLLPKIAVVGRPNVGKSALFNSICKKRIAIVDEAEGITRDRLYTTAEFFGREFELIDTGGINPRSSVAFNDQIKQQAEIAIQEANSIIMVVDSQVGITDLDEELAKILLKTKKPVCLAVNKIDDMSLLPLVDTFYSLGIFPIIAVSATQRWHIAELIEAALTRLPISIEDEPEAEESSAAIRLAIVGRPNVGKSSLINFILKEERCIASPIPGTTRDSVDIPFSWEESQFVLVDTAGIRRKRAEHEVVDKFAAIRTERAIEHADVCALMVDAQQGITAQEKKIASDIEKAGKGCVILLNKWDLVQGHRMEHCLKSIDDELPFLKHSPKLFISAMMGRNVEKIFPTVVEIYNAASRKIPTPELNRFIEQALQRNHPAMIRGKRLRIYYLTQVGTNPPQFALFCNYPYLMLDSYKKYLVNQFREAFDLVGVPLQLFLKGKRRQKGVEEQRERAKPSTPAVQYQHARQEDDDDEAFNPDDFEDYDSYEE
jgi:GTP-binding protein